MSNVISSLTGAAGGAGGTGFSGPQQASLINSATQQQADQLYGQGQTAIQNQANFLQAVQAQGGLGKQTDVYGQLQGVAAGTGPNPAQAQLAQATGANVANQAAMAASQRGSAANVGMMARQAGQQGAGIQQNAAGQAATLQAQQSLNALGQMGGMANQMAGQQAAATGAYTGAVQGQQGQTLGAIAAQNAATAGVQSSINAANASMANTRMAGQAKLVGNVMGGAGGAMNLFAEGGGVSAAPLDTTSQPQQPSIASSGHKSKVGQALHASSNALSSEQPESDSLSEGSYSFGKGLGHVLNKGYDTLFGSTKDSAQSADFIGGPGTDPNNLSGVSTQTTDIPNANPADKQAPIESVPTGSDIGQTTEPMRAARGGPVPALVSPGEQYIPPEELHKVAKGKDPLSVGERIPGTPKHPGNDYRNDTVKKTLKEGGIVIPNEIMQGPNPHWAAKKFVEAHMAKQGLRPQMPKRPKK